MIENTLQELIDFLEKEPGSRPKVIAEELGISRQYVQKLLANNENLFSVSGTGPNRFYRIKPTSSAKVEILTNFKDSNLIEENLKALIHKCLYTYCSVSTYIALFFFYKKIKSIVMNLKFKTLASFKYQLKIL
jgi:hypothetical protein